MAAGTQATGTWVTGQGAALPVNVDFNGLSAAMKEVYGPRVTSQLPQEVTMYRIFEERIGAEMADGRVFVESLHTGRNRSGGARPATGTALPGPQTQDYDRYEIPVRNYHSAGGLSYDVLARTQRAEASLVNVLDTEVNGAINDLKKELNVDLYGYPSGSLSIVRSVEGALVGGDTVINLYPTLAEDDFDDGHADSQNFLAMQGSRFLSGGLPLHIAGFNTATGALTYRQTAAGDNAATAINVVSKGAFNTVTVDGDQRNGGDAIVQGDHLIRFANHGTTVGDLAVQCLDGLEYLIDDTTLVPPIFDSLQGLDRSADTIHRSTVIDKDGDPVEEQDIFNLVYRVQEESGESPTFLLTSRAGENVIYNFYERNGRFAPRTFPGGYEAMALSISVGGVDLPIYVDKDCPYRTIYALNANHLKRYTLYEFHIAEQGGSILERSDVGDDTWVFRLRWAGNLGTDEPNSLGKVTNISGNGDADDGHMLQTYGAGTSPVTF